VTTIARAQRAIDKAGIPLILIRGEGYHYFVYDNRGDDYETVSVMVPYTKDYSAAEWADLAAYTLADIKQRIKQRGY